MRFFFFSLLFFLFSALFIFQWGRGCGHICRQHPGVVSPFLPCTWTTLAKNHSENWQFLKPIEQEKCWSRKHRAALDCDYITTEEIQNCGQQDWKSVPEPTAKLAEVSWIRLKTLSIRHLAEYQMGGGRIGEVLAPSLARRWWGHWNRDLMESLCWILPVCIV